MPATTFLNYRHREREGHRMENYFETPCNIFDLGLKSGELSVYIYFCHVKSTNGKINYPIEQIASEIGISTSTVSRAIKGLEERKLITKINKTVTNYDDKNSYEGFKLANEYEIHYPKAEGDYNEDR
jgi:DNA-binding transcriptional ArsR family regulator